MHCTRHRWSPHTRDLSLKHTRDVPCRCGNGGNGVCARHLKECVTCPVVRSVAATSRGRSSGPPVSGASQPPLLGPIRTPPSPSPHTLSQPSSPSIPSVLYSYAFPTHTQAEMLATRASLMPRIAGGRRVAAPRPAAARRACVVVRAQVRNVTAASPEGRTLQGSRPLIELVAAGPSPPFVCGSSSSDPSPCPPLPCPQEDKSAPSTSASEATPLAAAPAEGAASFTLLSATQEALNGRAAMLGFVAAVVSESLTHHSVLSQMLGVTRDGEVVEVRDSL